MLCAAIGVAIILHPFASVAAGASRPPAEWRTHVTVNDALGNVLYVVTDMHYVDNAGGRSEVLVLDKLTDQRFVMTRKYDVENHRSLMQIADVAGKKYVRRWYPLPSAAKTRDELSAELEANPRLFDIADPIFTLETPGSSYTTRESELPKADTPARWVSDIRESLDPAFLEGLERMRASLFGTTLAEPFYSTLARYLFHGGCPPPSAAATIVEEFPDCGFDKSFGFACSDRQIERITKAREEKRTLDHY
jgi:hypothetical protein